MLEGCQSSMRFVHLCQQDCSSSSILSYSTQKQPIHQVSGFGDALSKTYSLSAAANSTMDQQINDLNMLQGQENVHPASNVTVTVQSNTVGIMVG